jgi:hypothetical protein
MKPVLAVSICLWLAAALPAAGAATGPAAGDFDPHVTRMERSESLYLEHLFELLDEVAAASHEVGRWFVSGRSEGLHFEAYRGRVDALIAEIERLSPPERLAEMEGLLVGAIRLQRDFFADWYGALEEGRAFDSQLTSEYGYHEGQHLSQRKLLDAYGRLLALFPREGDANRRSFHHQLCQLDLACGGAVR